MANPLDGSAMLISQTTSSSKLENRKNEGVDSGALLFQIRASPFLATLTFYAVPGSEE